MASSDAKPRPEKNLRRAATPALAARVADTHRWSDSMNSIEVSDFHRAMPRPMYSIARLAEV